MYLPYTTPSQNLKNARYYNKVAKIIISIHKASHKQDKGEPIKPTIIVRLPNWLGDGVMSTPCIELLFAHFPTAKLCLVAPKSILELFSADPRIYAYFEDSTKQAKNRLKATWQLGRAIRSKLEREGGIDIAITLTNHFYSALLLYACGSKMRIGYKRGIGNVFLTHKLDKSKGLHQVESYARLLDVLPTLESKNLDSRVIAPSSIPPLRLYTQPLDSSKPKHLRIGLNPGAAYGSAKCWDKEYYARVGAHFAAMGAEVVIYGVKADRELAEWIIKAINSLLGSQSADFEDLESSQTSSLVSPPKFAKNYENNTAKQATAVQGEAETGFFRMPRILENAGQTKKLDSSLSPSSRALREQSAAIHNSAPAESINQSRTLSKVRNLESVQGVWGFKGDKGERFASSPPVSLEKSLSQVTPESSDNEKKVDSSKQVDCHEKSSDFSRNDKNNSAPDCHADKSARNDRKNNPCEKLDSSTNAPSLSSRAVRQHGEAIHNKKVDARRFAQMPKITNACGQTTIQALLQELQALDLFITNDSGSMHIAAALQTPMVAIFGPTNMTETAPWQARDCVLLNLNLPCAPCKKRVCPLGHHKCMKDLRPEAVIQACQRLLNAHH